MEIDQLREDVKAGKVREGEMGIVRHGFDSMLECSILGREFLS